MKNKRTRRAGRRVQLKCLLQRLNQVGEFNPAVFAAPVRDPLQQDTIAPALRNSPSPGPFILKKIPRPVACVNQSSRPLPRPPRWSQIQKPQTTLPELGLARVPTRPRSVASQAPRRVIAAPLPAEPQSTDPLPMPRQLRITKVEPVHITIKREKINAVRKCALWINKYTAQN